MDLDDITLFLDVVRLESFAGAARQHDIDPSAVSRALARLEDDIGTRLLHRTTRSLALTEAGERFLHHAEALRRDYEAARRDATLATEVPRGTVRLTASVGFSQECIVPLLKPLRERYGEVRIELLATDANLDLAAEGIDLAIRLAPRPEGDYVVSLLRPTIYRVVAAPELLAAQRIAAPAELAEAPCLCFPLPGFRTRWRLRDREGKVSEVPVAGPIETTSSLALRELARQGVGVALLADWLVDRDIAAGRLVDVFPEHEATATEFDTAAWLLYSSRRFLPAKTRVVIDFLKQAFAGAAGRRPWRGGPIRLSRNRPGG